ncbi:MAG: hypothetical protein IJL67_09710, partial [Oscillospiraceae bacterium]|nr:hypothetical protein [Oscillospiraceae bacterium]
LPREGGSDSPLKGGWIRQSGENAYRRQGFSPKGRVDPPPKEKMDSPQRRSPQKKRTIKIRRSRRVICGSIIGK